MCICILLYIKIIFVILLGNKLGTVNCVPSRSECTQTVVNSIRVFNDQQGQIKLKESALERSTNTFLEKERDLQDKIEELDKRLEELSLNADRLSEQESPKVSYKPLTHYFTLVNVSSKKFMLLLRTYKLVHKDNKLSIQVLLYGYNLNADQN